jgi:CDGSH-type Zn-finger protein
MSFSGKRPIVRAMKAGTYFWCSCGLTKHEPFCDGAHKGTGMIPREAEILEDKNVAWCTCKLSRLGPFCDGTHSRGQGRE